MNDSTKKELAELLGAVCEHPECPEWLMDGIWDLVNDKGGAVMYNSVWWLHQFESIEKKENWRKEEKKKQQFDVLSSETIEVEDE